jgi:NADPH2:quinone reductase
MEEEGRLELTQRLSFATHRVMQPGKKVTLSEWAETPLEALEKFLHLEEQPAPDPATLGANDVLLRVKSCAVGWVDLIMSSGQYQHAVKPPYTPGLEFAGEVVWVGANVSKVKIGDAVLADGLITGPRSSGAYQKYGGFATYAALHENAAIPIPEGFSYDQAVNLLGNYETAYHVLIHRARLQQGEFVLINGASGSTGLAAVEIAKLIGANVIATGRSEEKLAQIKAQGADHTIAIDDGAGGIKRFRDEVKALTGGKGAHVVYDGVGGPISVESMHAMRFGGRFCIVGWAATPFVAKGKGERGAPNVNLLPTNLIQMKGLDVLGCPAVISLQFDPQLRPTRLQWILARVKEGKLKPHVGPSYPLEQFKEAMIAKWESRFLGGCVLHP